MSEDDTYNRLKYKIMKIEPQVGQMSLVGVGKQRPCSWGNYFWFASGGPRCLNMWAENLQEAVKRFLPDNLVEIAVWDDFAIVIDQRIPKNWLHQKLCFTGCYSPSPEIAKEIYEMIGDPNNELEQFTDPVSYHAKRGGSYNPLTGIIMYRVGGK